MLVHQDSPYVEHFARQSDGSWTFREYKGEESIVKIDSIACSVRLGDVYSDLPE